MLTSMFFSLFKTQLTKGQRYRFSLIINELKNAEVVPYMTTCLAFINTILIATEDFEERVRLRNEFAGEKERDWYQDPPKENAVLNHRVCVNSFSLLE